MNVLKHLLVDPNSFASLPSEKLEGIGIVANDLGMTTSHGVAAIGSILASAAKNDDIGLSADTIAALGYLLQSLGSLGSYSANIEASADNHVRSRVAKQEA